MKAIDKFEQSIVSAYEELKGEIEQLYEAGDFGTLYEMQCEFEDRRVTLSFNCAGEEEDTEIELDCDSFWQLLSINKYDSLCEKVLQNKTMTSEAVLGWLGKMSRFNGSSIALDRLIANPSFGNYLKENPLFLVDVVNQIKSANLEREHIKNLICQYPEAVKTLLEQKKLQGDVCRLIDKIICFFAIDKISDEELKAVISFASENNIELSRTATVIKQGLSVSFATE